MRNSTRQFVLLLGSMLCFSNGGSLFAGMTCQPECVPVDLADIFPRDIVARGPVCPSAEDHCLDQKMPTVCPESIAVQDASSHLVGGSMSVPVEKPFCPNGEYKGLNGEEGPEPTPAKPPSPSKRSEAGTTGIALNIGTRDQQAGLPACPADPTREGKEELRFQNTRLGSDPPVGRLFRPPRERF
jgi:hypothetical protein